MVLRCACALDIILELFFVTFLLCELCHFLTSDFMKVYRQWVPCKRNSLYNFNPFFMQLCISFFHDLKVCMWFGFNFAINLCHFSFTLSFFNFSQMRHHLSEVLSIVFDCFSFISVYVACQLFFYLLGARI